MVKEFVLREYNRYIFRYSKEIKMENILVKEYYDWFSTYVKKFYGEDSLINQNIELKEIHTLKVAEHAVNIAKSLNLTQKKLIQRR